MNEFIAMALMITGALILVLAGIGILRMPDLFTRMQAAAKASTLGVALIVLGAAFHFGNLAISSRAALVIIFLFITAPVGTHMITRAAYFIGVPLWHGSIRDDLKGRYNMESHELESHPISPEDWY